MGCQYILGTMLPGSSIRRNDEDGSESEEDGADFEPFGGIRIRSTGHLHFILTISRRPFLSLQDP